MNKKDWNPDLYLKFNKERIQPSIDLIERINIEKPEKIIDIGCGPGNSTQILAQRWPHSDITGVDNSPAMIEKAKNDYPGQKWGILDAGKEKIEGKYDIVFSNAVIQWIPNHLDLFRKLWGILSERGLIAIQLPLFFDMPLGKSIANVAKDKRWANITEDVTNLFTIHNYPVYYNYLSGLFKTIDMWVTDYIHVMDSHLSILEMIRSTGLKPYLAKLENDLDKKNFEEEVMNDIKKDYPLQEDGKVLLPFKRLFFIAKNKL